MMKFYFVLLAASLFFLSPFLNSGAALLKAGATKVNITNTEVGGVVKDSVYARVLVLDDGVNKAVIISADVIIIGEFRGGTIVNYFLDDVRASLLNDPGIKPENIIINASQIHTRRPIAPDIGQRIVKGVRSAWRNRVPVNIGTGTGFENRISENRRLKLTDGRDWTIRHANPLPPDEEVAGIGPIDPEIGILRLDRKNGTTLAVLYNFTCHPYQDSGRSLERGTTGDYPGYASGIIEDNLGHGAVALFLQGCDGDITTVMYKDVNNPRDSEPLGNMLGLSTLKGLKTINCSPLNNGIKMVSETVELPRRTDIPERIQSLRAEQDKLLQSLQGTSLNMKTFIPLYVKYGLSGEYPSYYSHMYLHEKSIGKSDFTSLDDENRRNMDKYIRNIHAMEKLTRIQENMSFLTRWQAENEALNWKPIKVEVSGIRIGDFVMVTFPGEAVVEIGLNVKKNSPYKYTFVSGHTNGNLFYAPTEAQYKGEDYEDSNTPLAPEWQKIYEKKIAEILKKL